jgi:hypothetical protein
MYATTRDNMTTAQKESARDLSDLSPQLLPYRGWRVEVVRTDGSKARFIVGQSTGWRPCTLEISRRSALGGNPADRTYASVRPLYRVR